MEKMRKSIPRERIISDAKRILPYGRQYVIISIYEVLDKHGAVYEKKDASTIVSEISIFGNKSRFLISVNEKESGTEMTVKMAQPGEELSDDDIQRATTAVADSIIQYLQKELVLSQLDEIKNCIKSCKKA